MGAMSASIKIKGPRQVTCSRRTEVPRKRSDDLDSYHSHHHLPVLAEKIDVQTKKEKKISTSDSRLSRDDGLLKSVVFSSKTASESKGRLDSPRKQASAYRTKPSSPQESKSSRRKTQCSSKLVQTSSSITRTVPVSRRSIAVGVSEIDIGILEKLQSKPISKSPRRCSPQTSRRRPVPDSRMTIKSESVNSGASVPFSHSRTESTVMAALEAPLASYRHSRCMADHTYVSSTKRTSLRHPRKNKTKPKAPPALL